jgi:MYXO-CTERM domain-containing protein
LGSVFLLGALLVLAPEGESLTTPISGAVALPASFDLRLPFEAGETCRISAGYSPSGGSSLHADTNRTDKANEYYALDFVLPNHPNNGLGQQVLAVASGTVVLAGWATAGWANYGQRVAIEHDYNADGHRYVSNYCHLNAIYVTVNQHVAQGEAIGELGDSCNDSSDSRYLDCPWFGAHLHFSLHRDSYIGGSGTGGSYGGNAVVPEPFSGYEDLAAGQDLVSDNTGLPPQPCQVIQPVETFLEDDGPCFRRFGPSQYFHDEASGHGGSCVWTYTIDALQADNYAVWNLHFAQGGAYELSVFIPAAFGESVQAAYLVRASGQESTVIVNQSSHPDGLAPLGSFDFAAGGDQWVRLADNTGEPYVSETENTMIVFDALRIAPQGSCSCTSGDPPQVQPCDRCGTQTRSCDGCQWPDWSTVACLGQGECAEGDEELDPTSCVAGDARQRVCDSTCAWGEWSGCQELPPDASVPPSDAGPDAGSPPPGGGHGGCGCDHGGGEGSPGATMGLVLFAWVLARRSRRRTRCK